MLLQGVVSEEAQRCARPRASRLRLNPMAFSGNTKRCQTKAGRRNAGNAAMFLIRWRAISARTIEHQTCARITLLPKILKGTTLEVFEEYFVAG